LRKSQINPSEEKYWILKEACQFEMGKSSFVARILSTSEEVRKTLGDTFFDKCVNYCSLRVDRYRYNEREEEWFDVSTFFGNTRKIGGYRAICSSIHNH